MSNINDFIVELGTEELPPLSLEKLSNAFHDNLLALIDEAGLTHQKSYSYATPRRLTVVIDDLAEAEKLFPIELENPAMLERETA